MLTSKSSKRESYADRRQVEPTLLFGELRESELVPKQALGPLANAIEAISILTQAPEAIAMQSVLAATSVAVQALVNVETLQGFAPTSCFFLTVAQSGERKSACDSLATVAIDEFDQARVRVYFKKKREYETAKAEFQRRRRRSGAGEYEVIETGHDCEEQDLPPEPPLFPAIRISDPTIEGLFRHLEIGHPSVAVLTDEGGQFFGGHSMKRENALKTAAGFSKLWDGAPLSRSRASAEPVWLCGKRVSLHLMIQPGVAQGVVGDPTMKDQGLLSRVLIAWPSSRIGSRVIRNGIAQREIEELARLYLDQFHARISELLRMELPLHPDTRAELEPRKLYLSDEARALLEAFYNRVEVASGKGGAFEYISGFAAKAPEMAARLGGLQCVFADEHAVEISAPEMENGISLMEWYLSEMLRISDSGRPDQDLCQAEIIRLWLHNNWREDFIDKRTLMKKGPGHLRDGNTLSRIIQVLEAHEWLVRGSGKQVVDGTTSKTFWRVVRMEAQA